MKYIFLHFKYLFTACEKHNLLVIYFVYILAPTAWQWNTAQRFRFNFLWKLHLRNTAWNCYSPINIDNWDLSFP